MLIFYAVVERTRHHSHAVVNILPNMVVYFVHLRNTTLPDFKVEMLLDTQ